MGDNIEHINCNLCESNSYKTIFKGIPDEEGNVEEKYKSSGNQISADHIVKCNNCGLMYVNPRLNPDSIIGGYSEGSDENFVSQAKGRELTFRKCLSLIEKYTVGKGKVLDIGTAGGSFLHVAKQNGWDVYGIEPNKWLCNWAKENYNLNINQGTIFNIKYPDNHFDVITLWDVLEHTPDPKKVLTEVNRILKKDGLLVVNYPDVGSWIAKLMKSKWVFLLTVHLYYFTPKTIKVMLNKTNFQTIKIKPHFQKLSLGYLVYRMEPYSKLLHKVGSKVVNLLKMGNLQIPYWLGQTLVLARKK
jgi:2-polyprenyl-3-methyl-5-hydroxy-6-metoxy-1,4-benzoquinol methylase